MKWYQKNYGIILVLIIFFPIGLYLMWKYAEWNKKIKGVITGILALMVIGSVAAPERDPSNPDYATVDVASTAHETFSPEPANTQVLPTETTTESPSLTPDPTVNPTTIPTTKPTVEPTTNTPSNDVDNNNHNIEGNNNFDTYDNPEQQETKESWVLNTKSDSMKIHYPSCRTVPKIAPANYATSSESLDTLKSQGYTTCGICFK